MDLYYRDRKCPICKSKLLSTYSCRFKPGTLVPSFCINKCYGSVSMRSYGKKIYSQIDFFIFNKKYSLKTIYSRKKKKAVKKEIIKQIQYWKENDRYLIKIMTK
ncbi:MAG: hypothetical protein K0R18_508 [Bacillales bacterium]|jgi:hypothetical protein|nr:hypothetical protein [Bacillales bacterium]